MASRISVPIMPVKLYAHLSWATAGRLSMIDARTEGFLRRFLPLEARRHGACILALGMVTDHVHLVLRLPAVSDIPRLVQGFKKGRVPGSSTSPAPPNARC